MEVQIGGSVTGFKLVSRPQPPASTCWEPPFVVALPGTTAHTTAPRDGHTTSGLAGCRYSPRISEVRLLHSFLYEDAYIFIIFILGNRQII